MDTIIENIADANARIHSLNKELAAEREKVKALESKQSEVEDNAKKENGQFEALKADLSALTKRMDATESKVALLRPKSDPTSRVANLPSVEEWREKSIDELYAKQAELPTWQERQAFFDNFIAPKMEKEIDRIRK